MNVFWCRFVFFLMLLFVAFISDLSSQQRGLHPLSRKGTFYTSNFVGASYCRVGGVDGRERRTYINDLVSNSKSKGADSHGGMYPRIGAVIGGQGGYFFSNRFAFGGEFSYSQKGYQENIYYHYGDTTYSSKIKVRVDYLDLSLGILYQTDFKISIFLGGGVGLCLRDRVINKFKLESGDTLIEKNERIYVNQYFYNDRKLYLPQYTWGITYKIRKYWAISFRVQKTSNMFVLAPEQNFLLFQFALVRKYIG